MLQPPKRSRRHSSQSTTLLVLRSRTAECDHIFSNSPVSVTCIGHVATSIGFSSTDFSSTGFLDPASRQSRLLISNQDGRTGPSHAPRSGSGQTPPLGSGHSPETRWLSDPQEFRFAALPDLSTRGPTRLPRTLAFHQRCPRSTVRRDRAARLSYPMTIPSSGASACRWPPRWSS